MSGGCPCGSGSLYAACCGLYHSGAAAPTAEALMRSRYSAYALREAAYLLRTSHPLLRARTTIRSLQPSFALEWIGLEIVAATDGGPDDSVGMVHFRAHYRGPAGSGVLEERSRFVRDRDGEWVYRDGVVG